MNAVKKAINREPKAIEEAYSLKLEIRARNNPSPILPIYLPRIQVTLIIF